MFVYELSGGGFKSHCSHLNFRYRSCLEQGVLDIQATIECGFTLKCVRDMITYSQEPPSLHFSFGWQIYDVALQIQVLSMLAIKCWGEFRIFQFDLAIRRHKKPPKTQQKPFYITSLIASAYLGILPRAMICFFNSWDNLFYLNYIVYLSHTWRGPMEDISLIDSLVLVSSCVLVTVGEHIFQH